MQLGVKADVSAIVVDPLAAEEAAKDDEPFVQARSPDRGIALLAEVAEVRVR